MKLVRRPRRLRKNENIRNLVMEIDINKRDFVYPMFVLSGNGIKREIKSMPNIYQYSLDRLLYEIENIMNIGIKSIILFGIPSYKDEWGSGAYDENGVVQRAVKEVKKRFSDLTVIADVCLCEYTSHGHCGLINEGEIENDMTLKLLNKTSLSLANAGADILAPSDMMDGRVCSIREVLDINGFSNLPIMSYSVKYASAFYGPFRDAADSAPKFGDRKSYQMDYRRRVEAFTEVELDINEGADIVIIKPAMAYLDIIRSIKEEFNIPIATYNVSGEYSMVKLASRNGLLNEKDVVLEMMTSMKRAGADIIITYFAKDICSWI